MNSPGLKIFSKESEKEGRKKRVGSRYSDWRFPHDPIPGYYAPQSGSLTVGRDRSHPPYRGRPPAAGRLSRPPVGEEIWVRNDRSLRLDVRRGAHKVGEIVRFEPNFPRQ